MSWRLAKSLEKLREQINAAFPSRSKVSDGSIGDPAHAARASDHNPNSAGVVTAIDITHDPDNGPDGHLLSRQLISDSRTKYVIFAGEIFKARTGKWEPYRGPNRHDKHVHISVLANPDEYDNSAPWKFPSGVRAFTRSTLRRGDTGTAVQDLQRRLGVKVDGNFGPSTELAVREWQAFSHLKVDGIVGPATNESLFGPDVSKIAADLANPVQDARNSIE